MEYVDRQEKNRRGFSLVELMMVIIIVIILASFMVPGIMGTSSTQDAKEVAAKVVDVITFAKAQATLTNRAHRIHIEPAGANDGGMLVVERGDTAICAFVDPLTVRTVVLQYEGDQSVISVSADDPTLETIWTATRIVEVAPDAAAQNDICVRPDGSIRDAVTNMPVQPGQDTGYGAGDVVIVLEENAVSGTPPDFTPTGAQFRVILPYNGIGRVTY